MGGWFSYAVAWLYGRAYLLLVFTALCWGSNVVAGRLAVGRVSPMAVVSLRWLIVVVLLALFSGRQIRADLPALRPHWRWLLLLGSLGYTAFNALFYIAAHYTTAINLGIIQAGMPAFVVLGGLVVYGTRVRLVQTVGLGLTLAGAIWVACRGDWAVLRTLSFNIGDLMVLAAAMFYAGYTTMLVRRPAVAGISLFAGMAFAAFLTSLPLLGAEMAMGLTVWPDALGWALMAHIAVFPSLLSQLFYLRGVDLIGPARAGIFTNLVPIFAALLSVLILREPFEPFHAAALAMVFGGIWLAETGGRRPAQIAPSVSASPPDREGG